MTRQQSLGDGRRHQESGCLCWSRGSQTRSEDGTSRRTCADARLKLLFREQSAAHGIGFSTPPRDGMRRASLPGRTLASRGGNILSERPLSRSGLPILRRQLIAVSHRQDNLGVSAASLACSLWWSSPRKTPSPHTSRTPFLPPTPTQSPDQTACASIPRLSGFGLTRLARNARD